MNLDSKRMDQHERALEKMLILVPLLAIIALIQVLPQVDLPETAFHEDTAPVVVKFRFAAPPVMSIAQPAILPAAAIEILALNETSQIATHPVNTSRPILNSALLC